MEPSNTGAIVIAACGGGRERGRGGMMVVRAPRCDEAKHHVEDGGSHTLLPLSFPHRGKLVVVTWRSR